MGACRTGFKPGATFCRNILFLERNILYLLKKCPVFQERNVLYLERNVLLLREKCFVSRETNWVSRSLLQREISCFLRSAVISSNLIGHAQRINLVTTEFCSLVTTENVVLLDNEISANDTPYHRPSHPSPSLSSHLLLTSLFS